MDPDGMARILARLTVRAQNLGERSSGGIDGLTPQDIAAACAGMADDQYLLLLRLYTQDRTVQKRLFYVIYDESTKIATRSKWRVPDGKELVRKMVELAIAEVINPRACPACNGKGEVWLKGMAVPTQCQACEGGGRKPPTTREKAKALDLEESNFAKHWRSKYEKIFNYVNSLDVGALEFLRKKLQRSEN